MRMMTMVLFVALITAPQAMAQENDSTNERRATAVQDAKPETAAPPKETKRQEASEHKGQNKANDRRSPMGSNSQNQQRKNAVDEDGGERFPHGSCWNGDVYGASGWWASVHIGGGVSLVQINEGIAASGSQIATGFYFGSTLHASHRWGLTLDLAMSSVSVTGDGLQTGWTEYKVQNLMVTLGGKIYPFAEELWSLALGAHVGFNQYDSSVVGDVGTVSWGGPEAVLGGIFEFSYYPMHALEIGLNIRVDSLMGGDNDAEFEWQGTGAPSSSRLLVGASLLLGFHF